MTDHNKRIFASTIMVGDQPWNKGKTPDGKKALGVRINNIRFGDEGRLNRALNRLGINHKEIESTQQANTMVVTVSDPQDVQKLKEAKNMADIFHIGRGRWLDGGDENRQRMKTIATKPIEIIRFTHKHVIDPIEGQRTEEALKSQGIAYSKDCAGVVKVKGEDLQKLNDIIGQSKTLEQDFVSQQNPTSTRTTIASTGGSSAPPQWVIDKVADQYDSHLGRGGRKFTRSGANQVRTLKEQLNIESMQTDDPQQRAQNLRRIMEAISAGNVITRDHKPQRGIDNSTQGYHR